MDLKDIEHGAENTLIPQQMREAINQFRQVDVGDAPDLSLDVVELNQQVLGVALQFQLATVVFGLGFQDVEEDGEDTIAHAVDALPHTRLVLLDHWIAQVLEDGMETRVFSMFHLEIQ